MAKYEAKDLELEDKDDWMFRIPGGTTMKQAEAMKRAEEKQHTAELRGPESVGDFEHLGEAAATHLVQPLTLGDAAKQHAGSTLEGYEASYNMYVSPMRNTVRAMGRVKDLQLAGAALTADELRADKQLAHKFRRLTVNAKSDADEQGAFAHWQKSQAMLHKDFSDAVVARAMLEGVLGRFQRAQNLLQRRALEADKAAKQDEKDKIDQAAATLTKIVHVSVDACNAIGYLDAFADYAFAPSHEAEPDFGIRGTRNHVPQLNPHLMDGDPAFSRTTQQNAAAGLTHYAGKFRAINQNSFVQRAKQNQPFSLKEVFIWAMGDSGKYEQLQRDIARLEQEIGELDIKNEDLEIKSARDDLEAFSLNLQVKERAVAADRSLTRGDAQVFAQSMGGGDKGLLAMYAADAYQELAMFANEADSARERSVDPKWGWVKRYAGNYKLTYEAQYWHADWHRLVDNIYGVQGQRKLVEKNLGEWTGRAQDWRKFLREVTQKSLVTGE